MENKPSESWIRSLVHAEVERAQMNMTAREHFAATVAKIDALEMETALRRLICDSWGTRTWMVEEPNYLSEGLR